MVDVNKFFNEVKDWLIDIPNSREEYEERFGKNRQLDTNINTLKPKGDLIEKYKSGRNERKVYKRLGLFVKRTSYK